MYCVSKREKRCSVHTCAMLRNVVPALLKKSLIILLRGTFISFLKIIFDRSTPLKKLNYKIFSQQCTIHHHRDQVNLWLINNGKIRQTLERPKKCARTFDKITKFVESCLSNNLSFALSLISPGQK